MMIGYLLFFILETKFSAVPYSMEFETEQLCQQAKLALMRRYPGQIKEPLCLQQEVGL